MLHDEYGKSVVQNAAGDAFHQYDNRIDYGKGAGYALIDGTIDSRIAVEIESRTGKQVRGAVLELLWHHLPHKLILIVPVHMHNPTATAEQCRIILGRTLLPSNFRVVLLEGS